MKKIYTFGKEYSNEKYPFNKVEGFVRWKTNEFGPEWYGGKVNYLLKKGPVVVFVGEKGTLDAGCLRDGLNDIDSKDLRAAYINQFGSPAEKTWQKDTIIAKLTG